MEPDSLSFLTLITNFKSNLVFCIRHSVFCKISLPCLKACPAHTEAAGLLKTYSPKTCCLDTCPIVHFTVTGASEARVDLVSMEPFLLYASVNSSCAQPCSSLGGGVWGGGGCFSYAN